MVTEEASGSSSASLLELHHRVLAYWERSGVPARAIGGALDGPVFRFTEGPPTANGAPHIGHVVGRTLKDIQLRYRRMRGFRIISSMAGWDCHGLPVELGIERRHGFRSKHQIEEYGIGRFCEECRASTLEVADVWQEMSRRLGYWLDYAHPYLTMSAPYIESVWWSLKTLFDRGLLEKGYYVLPYCPRCETPLSSHEVAQGYRETTDPSVTVRFPLQDPPGGRRSLLVWTTTPWTLPANLLVAAKADLTYLVVQAPDGREEVVAEEALPRYYPGGAPVLARISGRELAGQTYRPPFPFVPLGSGRFRVVLDDMVAADEGTGFVHIAPSFGLEDQRVGAREGVGMFDPLDGRGHFTDQVPIVAGKSFKAADPVLVEDLRQRDLLVRATTIKHTYPFCWRCSNPLIYRAVDSWFVRASRFVAELQSNNEQVQWVPRHLKEGRFGNFLEQAKDWALSRNRYWGTPLPVWRCPTGHFTCIGSYEELVERSGAPLPAPFDPHRVTVDRIALRCSTCGLESRREPYTIDGWYDSGAAPFAQYHYPFEPGPFDPSAPLDYIAEGLDQTRGWFYTLLVLSTALFHRTATRVCVAHGLVLDSEGQKMSKSKGNAVEPMALLARLGGDPVRWGFLTSDYTEPLRPSETEFQRGGGRTLGTLVHVVEFYTQNARADGFSARVELPSPPSALDRWLLSRLEATRAEVDRALSTFDPRPGALALRTFVDDLSTWYLRRSRPRFWSAEDPADRQSAHDTLSFALGVLARLMAPYTPFVAEHVYQEVTQAEFAGPDRSVHLQPWPEPIPSRDPPLEEAMAELRTWVEIARELRQRAQVKSRIPLEEFVLFGEPPAAFATLGNDATALLEEELNVRRITWAPRATGDRYAESDWVVRSEEGRPVAALSRRPTPELLEEGWVREVLRRLQTTRKELRLAFTERIGVTIFARGPLYAALVRQRERVAQELLADPLAILDAAPPESADVRRWEIDGTTVGARIDRHEA
jgi:isoleucyl-tRNA synthetase